MKKVILVVDDNNLNRLVVREFLKDEFDIVEADCAAQAMVAAKNIPALIILDVLMPEVNGFELAKRLKADETTRSIPIVFLTCCNDPESRSIGYKVGAADYISRPIAKSTFKDRIKRNM
jgi:PleD family two-component response regulator